ncbi:SprT family zinc-dependent metalloprotease [Pseudoalteromonas sp. APC 3355]|uniref:M48 family metallopeptidase n=1 Tax=Pseudoalteromonas sp. APC 3355 TaxID=3035199 RepID=UPI0025B2F001|nr:SprT family zinc-dependent metalloprotease [Pseudoalteromonas sp. APC 3355]MDN3475249.1 SprT family zinc-dependent metalloprotease [Pseudoalteromonas sp. APC 3355]
MSMKVFEYQLKKSIKRKTVAIKVHNKKVTVYAPQFVSNKHIQEWLFDKQVWVNAQLTKQHNIADSRQNPLKDKQILIFDSIVNIEFKQSTKSEVLNCNDSLLITHSSRVKNTSQKYQQLLEEYLKEQLTAYIEMRLAYFCAQMGEELPTSLKVAIYKRKWGSCNSKRELTFNLHLIGAPYHAIDYVIVHELAHLRHLNHSKAFWQHVEHFFPNYKASSTWLKKNSMSLQWVF